LVLWLHGREDPAVVGTLVDHALAKLGGAAVVHAFPFATALGLGLEALPVRHRRATHRAMLERGFDGRDRWRYLRRGLPARDLMPRGACVRLSPVEEGKRRLSLHSGKQVLGEATVGVPVDGIGVLWWIEVDPATRGQGVGRTLLSCALDLLARAKAHEVILCVDDDNLETEGDRAAARALYEAAGFQEVDHLASFCREFSSDAARRTVGRTDGAVP
jgi:ribosomal protein S18 acetylase RimI-like enzyme